MVTEILNKLKAQADEQPEVTAAPDGQLLVEKNFNKYLLRKLHTIISEGPLLYGVFVDVYDDNTGASILYPIESQRVREEILDLYDDYEGDLKGKSLTDKKIKESIEFVKAKAKKQGSKRQLFKRTAWLANERVIAIDLSNEMGECLWITEDGWKIVRPTPSIFVRMECQLPMAMPIQLPDNEAYQVFKNILPSNMSEQDAKLMLGTLVGMLQPLMSKSLTYPVMLFKGDPGSGKSTLTNFVKDLVDHETTSLACEPNSLRDLYVVANGCHLLALDNMDFLKGNMSDAICKVTSGNAMRTRKYYTDNQQTTLVARNPVIMNGIGDVLRRQDVIDRSVTFILQRIKNPSSVAEDELQYALSVSLGYLCTLMSRALKNDKAAAPHKLPRLEAMARFVSRAEPFGECSESFVDLMLENQSRAQASSEEEMPVADALIDFMLACGKVSWTGTVKKLLDAITIYVDDDTRKSEYWAKTPKALANYLKNHKQPLENLGITVIKGKKVNNGHQVTLKRNEKFTHLKQSLFEESSAEVGVLE